MIKKNRELAAVLVALTVCIAVSIWFSAGGRGPKPEPELQPSFNPALPPADSLQLSLPPGWYGPGTSLSIDKSRNDSKLVYTLDGSEPTAESAVYNGPIALNGDLLVRAREYEADGTAGDEAAGFYSTNSKPALPVFVITTEPDLLWSDENGIYAIGKHGSAAPPYKGANFWGSTEIPVRFQMFDSDGRAVFESGAGMELFGGESRMQPQKSLELMSKRKYGQKNFSYPFFPSGSRDQFNSLILRNGGQDFPLTHMRDSVASLVARPILKDVQLYRPVAVYLNNRYWGIYDLREKMDANLLADRYGISAKSIDLLESDGEVKSGSDDAFKELLEALDQKENPEEQIGHLESLVDVDSLFDYMIVESYIGNTDWPDHNIRFWRSKEADGKWRWLLYDADLSFGDADEPTLARLLSPKLAKHPSVWLLQTLLKDSRMKERFLRRTGDLLNGPLGEKAVADIIKETKSALDPEMPRHLERWEGTISNWQSETDKLLQFAASRRRSLIEQLKNAFELTDHDLALFKLDMK